MLSLLRRHNIGYINKETVNQKNEWNKAVVGLRTLGYERRNRKVFQFVRFETSIVIIVFLVRIPISLIKR